MKIEEIPMASALAAARSRIEHHQAEMSNHMDKNNLKINIRPQYAEGFDLVVPSRLIDDELKRQLAYVDAQLQSLGVEVS